MVLGAYLPFLGLEKDRSWNNILIWEYNFLFNHKGDDPEMICDKCQDNIEEGEERELHGRTLCEDCYMDTLSPPKACDPWAVHSAKSFSGSPGIPDGLAGG